MKNTICTLLILSSSIGLFGQEIIPGAVLEAFAEREPSAQDVFWEYRDEVQAYAGMFSDMEGLKKIFFNQAGEWLETRTRLEKYELPAGVLLFIDQYYGTADITYMGKVDQPDRTVYRVESELPNSVVIKLLSKEGRLLEEQRIDWGHSQLMSLDTPDFLYGKVQPQRSGKE